MIDFLIKCYWYLSPYVSHEEKHIVSVINSKSPQLQVRELMQKNIFQFCVYLEYFSKGYKRLRKPYRKQLYRSIEFVRVEFLKFLAENQYDKKDRLKFFELVKVFLHDSKRYEYRESTFLGGMQNPQHLIGDCNQIVTLYVYLWSLLFDVSELKIKLEGNDETLTADELDGEVKG